MINETQFGELLERHTGLLEKLCYKTGVNEDDHEDLLQDIRAQAWKARDSFKGGPGFTTWLHRVAISVLATTYRKKKKFKVFFPEKLPETEDEIESDEKLCELSNAVDKLNNADKCLINLFLENHSHREIAAITNSSEKSVAMRFMRIKTKLRKLLNIKK